MGNPGMKGEIDGFFNPKSIAVIGVSSMDEEGPGRILFKNLLAGFGGKVFPINPKADKIDGVECYPDVSRVPEEIDLAIIATPAAVVPTVMESCARKGIGNVVIISGGFSETGHPELEKEIMRIAKGAGMRIIGPNCLGIYDAHSKINAFFLPNYRIRAPKAGNVAFLSQSGAVAGGGLDWAAAENLGISKIISYGNRIDVDECDMLDYLEKDPDTKVIMLYVEGLTDGKRFMETAKRVARKKPIVAFKVGNSEKGAGAVKSHTGSLAGDAKVYAGAFRQAGLSSRRPLRSCSISPRRSLFSSRPRDRGSR
jgi:acetate---CoA ligase (ADP-forming)